MARGSTTGGRTARQCWRVPLVAPRPRRAPGEPPAIPARAPLPEIPDAVLSRQQTARLARAEEKSLSPLYLDEVKARLAAERAVEENLARGRALTRHEIRKATDPARYGLDRRAVRFPRPACVSCDLLRPLVYGCVALFSPFMAYFALVLLILI